MSLTHFLESPALEVELLNGDLQFAKYTQNPIMNPTFVSRKFALSCVLITAFASTHSPGAVTPGGTFGDQAIIIENTAGETLAPATTGTGLGPVLVQEFDTGVFVEGSYELNPTTTNAAQIALSAGRHLVMYNSRFDVTAGSNRSEVMSNLTLAGSPLAIGRSHGLIRRTGGADEAVLSGGGIITVAADNDILTLESRRSDTNTAVTPFRVANSSAIQFLKLDNTWDFLSLQRSTNQAGAVGTTFTDVTYDANNSSGTMGTAFSFTTNSGDITLNESGLYLVFANTRLEKPADAVRTNYQQRLTLNGTEVKGSKTTTYLRGSANGENANSGVASLGTLVSANAGQILNVELAMESGGTASTIQGNETALTIVKLPLTAKSISLTHSVSQEVNNAAATPLIFNTLNSGSTAFSHTLGTSLVTVNAADDYLFFGTVFTESSDASEDHLRTLPYQGWQLNGSGGPVVQGRGAGYNRDSGGCRTGGSWGGLVTALASGNTVQLTSEALGTGNLGATGSVSFQGLSISSLIPSNDPAVATNLPLTVLPGSTGTIDETLLETFDPDTAPASLVYTLTSAPAGGTLSHTINGILNNTSTFTQDDLNNNRIQFAASASPVTGGFNFTVTDGSASDMGSFVIFVKYPDAHITLTSNGDVTEGLLASWTINSDLAPTGSPLTININYSGAAADGSDFTGVASVDLAAGTTTVALNVATVIDGLLEGCEPLVATIGTMTGGELNALAGTPSSAFLLINDSNSNPTGTNLSQVVVGTGTIPLNDIIAFDPDADYQSKITTAGAPLVNFNGPSNLTIFSDNRPLDDSSFDIDATGPGLNTGLGFSIEIDLAILPADLTGTVQIWEIGGSSNGSAILLVNGIPHLLVKSGGAAANFPTDSGATAGVFTDLDWATDNTIVVPLATTALVPGNPTRIALILSDANDSVTYSVNGASPATANLLNNDNNNWVGDHTFNVGINAGTGTGGNTNTASTPFTDVDLKNPAAGAAAVTCLKFWNQSTGSISANTGNLDQITVTLTIANWTATSGDLSATSGNGEAYFAGEWTITGDAASVNAALAAVEFVSGAGTTDPTLITISLEDGDEDGGGPTTGSIIITGATPDPIYVDDSLAGTSPGTSLPDVDGGAPVAPATMGLNAFATIAEAISAIGPDGTIIVNDGDYSTEAISLADTVTLELTGSGNTSGGSVITLASINSPAGPSIFLGNETLVVGDSNDMIISCVVSGNGNLTKEGSGRLIFRNSVTYTGTTTVNGGFLRAGYDSNPPVILGNFDGEGPIILNNNSVLEFNGGPGHTQTMTGAISGDGSVRKGDDGILIFDGPGANTFTGEFQLGDGSGTLFDGTSGAIQGFVVVNHNDHLGTGILHSRGAQLQAGTPGIVIPNNVEIDNGGFRVGGSNDIEFAGNVATINNSPRGFGNYGLEGVEFTISGDVVITGLGDMIFEGSEGKDNGAWTVTGNVSGDADVILQTNFDNGLATLSGENSYSGVTTLGSTAGILVFNGTHTGGAIYTVNDSSTLTGTGSTESAVTIGAAATLAPGANDIGTFSTGPLTLNGTLAIEIDNSAGGLAGIDWDLVAVTGAVNITGATLTVSQSATFEASPADIVVISNDDADLLTGTFAAGDPFSQDFMGSGLIGTIDYFGGNGNDLALTSGTTSIIGNWRIANFGSSSNNGIGGNFSDTGDNDSLSNLLEFAFGTNPNIADHADLALDGSVNGVPIVNVDFSGGSVEFSGVFARRDDHGTPGSIQYTPQFSSDLATWFDSTATPGLVADSTDDPAYEIVKIPYPFFLPDGKKARYFRVNVNLVP